MGIAVTGACDLSPGIAPNHLLRRGAYCPGTNTHFHNFLIKPEKKKNPSSFLRLGGWGTQDEVGDG